jgi:hypothetical protein
MAEIEAAWVEHIEIARMRVLGETDSRALVKCAHPTTLITKHPVTHNVYYVKLCVGLWLVAR